MPREQLTIFPRDADFGQPPAGWKPYKPEPRLKTASGTRILTADERDALMRRAWLGVKEAAAVAGVSDQQIYNWINDGTIVASLKSRVPGTDREHYNIDGRELAKFLASRRTDNLDA